MMKRVDVTAKRRGALRRLIAMSATVAMAVGCGRALEPNGSTGVKTATVVVTPSIPSMSIGAVFPLQAQALDASGNVVSSVTIHWSSSDTNVVTVSSLGVVSAKALGTAQIAASAEGKSAVATLTVVPVPVASVVVLPQNGTVVVGNKIELQAVMYDANGATLASRTVTWTTSAAGTATVDASGDVIGVAAGTVTINATSEGKSGSTTIVVTPVPPVITPVASVSVLPQNGAVIVGTTLALQAIPYDASGAVLTLRTVTWATSAPGTATVDASGKVTGVALGTVTITATSEGKSGSTTVVVNPVPPVPVASVSVQTPNGTPIVGSKVTLQAATYAANGATLTGRTVTWTTSAPGTAIVDASGTVTCVAPGTVTITGTSEGKTGSTTLLVQPVPVASVSVTSLTGIGTVIVGNTLPLQATTYAANGATLTGRTVTWSTNASGRATVNASGIVTGVSPGTVTITATSEGKRRSINIVVQPAPVASVSVQAPGGPLIVGNTVTLQATTYDANGVTLTGRTVTWSTNAPGTATVNASGTVTFLAPGLVTITGTSEGKSGSTTLLVLPVPVASVTVSPQTGNVIVGNTIALQATTYDLLGGTLTGRTVTWSTNASGTATVDASGNVTGVAPGTVTITATSEGQTGSAIIVVDAAVDQVVTDDPNVISVARQGTVNLSVRLLDVLGNILLGRTVVWTSSDPALATVAATGLTNTATVTALNTVGTVTITATYGGKSTTFTINIT